MDSWNGVPYDDDRLDDEMVCDFCGVDLPDRWTDSDHKPDCLLRKADRSYVEDEPSIVEADSLEGLTGRGELVRIVARCGSRTVEGLYPAKEIVRSDGIELVDLDKFLTRHWSRT